MNDKAAEAEGGSGISEYRLFDHLQDRVQMVVRCRRTGQMTQLRQTQLSQVSYKALETVFRML